MGWSGSLTESSAVGDAITYTPDTTAAHGYSIEAFTAPKKGVYAFVLKGSGGSVSSNSFANSISPGGEGGLTVGYLVLDKGQIVHIGAGGPCSAAFVAKETGAALKNIAKENLYFIAGGGGGGGSMWDNGSNNHSGAGGNGGGESGANGVSYGSSAGVGGTQTGGYAYGSGEPGEYANHDTYSTESGGGGDGLYGGTKGKFSSGGGGGAGYIHTASVDAAGKAYTNTTQQGGGAGSNTQGSVQVTYFAQEGLPVIFNGTRLGKLIFNGVEVGGLIYDGMRLFMRRLSDAAKNCNPARRYSPCLV